MYIYTYIHIYVYIYIMSIRIGNKVLDRWMHYSRRGQCCIICSVNLEHREYRLITVLLHPARTFIIVSHNHGSNVIPIRKYWCGMATFIYVSITCYPAFKYSNLKRNNSLLEIHRYTRQAIYSVHKNEAGIRKYGSRMCLLSIISKTCRAVKHNALWYSCQNM